VHYPEVTPQYDIDRAAIHEAGHVVMAVRYGWKPRWACTTATRLPRGNPTDFVGCQSEEDDCHSFLFFAAGAAAESLVYGRFDPRGVDGCNGDRGKLAGLVTIAEEHWPNNQPKPNHLNGDFCFHVKAAMAELKPYLDKVRAIADRIKRDGHIFREGIDEVMNG
jgi:hypothetical protein